MLRLSKKADYALIAMKHLVLGGEHASASAREIAELYDIPVELMAKVLQRLTRRDLLISHQGTRGGYMLARPADHISIAAVIEAVDGPLTMTACSSDDHDCEQYAKCNVRDPLWRIKDRILQALDTCSLLEIAQDAISELPPVGPRVGPRVGTVPVSAVTVQRGESDKSQALSEALSQTLSHKS